MTNLFNKYSIYSIDDIKKDYYSKTKGHWFDENTLRSFKSRFSDRILHDSNLFYFVSSEQSSREAKRAYSVRSYNPNNGVIDTVQDFQGFNSGAQAWSYVSKLIKKEL